MEIPLTLSIPYLWGENNDIKKNDWGSINYLIGPMEQEKVSLARN
jgi:hypothetical protein